MQKFYIVAGEASGDLHGSNLIHALKTLYPDAEYRGIGGDLMEQAGMKLDRHFKEVAYMGFLEVLLHVRKILTHLKRTSKAIQAYKPDVLILIDYPGFNLRLAPQVQSSCSNIVYYISPQIWAWKENRVYKIKETVDKMICILPFEQAFYRKHNMEVDYVGHPLLDHIASLNKPDSSIAENLVALLPGSRRQEISRMLPVMLEFAEEFPHYSFEIAKVISIPMDFYEKFLQNALPNVSIIENKLEHILQKASFAIVTSGTATLETALYKVPQIVCYKSSWISFQIAKRLIKVRYISLVNLIVNQEAVPEMIQDNLTASSLKSEFLKRTKPEAIKATMQMYKALESKLSKEGASKNAAALIQELLTSS